MHITDASLRCITYTQMMEGLSKFDPRFLAFAGSVYMGLKGGAGSLLRLAMLPLFKTLVNVSSSTQYQKLTLIVLLPWSLKGIFGLLSDFFPIFSFRKRYYILMASIVGTVAMAAVAATAATSASATTVAFLLFVVNVQIAWVDICTEAKYAEYMRGLPETGGLLVSLIWGSMFCAQTVAVIIGGLLADAGRTDIILWICTVLCGQVIGPTLAGWLAEDPCTAPEFDRGLVITAGTITAAAAGLTVVTLVGSWMVHIVYAVLSAVVISAVAWRYLPPDIARANQYMFMSSALYLSYPGSMDYFFTASSKCVPNGPAFPLSYYITVLGLSASVVGVFGIIIVQRFFGSASFRRLFWCTTGFKCIASIFDVVIVKRLNLPHIPDKVFMMLGSGMAIPLAQTMDAMPAVVLTSKLCPRQHEAVFYAILAGYQNFGSALSVLLGSAAAEAAGVEFNDDVCTYDNFAAMIVAGNVVLPLLCIPLAYFLIPDVSMTAKQLR